MKRVLTAAALAALLLDCSAACRPADPLHPSRGPMPYTTVDDGSWTAPDEIKPGLWRSRDDVAVKGDCGWYTTPPAPRVPSPDPGGRVSVVIDGKAVKSLTTLHCGPWDWVSDR